MSKGTGTIRRGAAILVVAVGLLAMTGPGASAAGVPLAPWSELSGSADSQALRISLTLPAVDGLAASLKKSLGSLVSNVTIPQLGIAGVKIEQTVSLTNADVARFVDAASTDFAAGFAAPLQGLLSKQVSSRCESATCDASDSVLKQEILLGTQDLNVGKIVVNAAESVTKSFVDTRNTTALAHVNVDLSSLIAEGAPLAAVGKALADLTAIVNSAVLPPVNKAIETVDTTVRDLLPDSIEEDVLDRVVTHVGPVKPIPDLRKFDLLDMTVLGAQADVFPQTRGGVEGLLARSSSKIADLNILGDWATIDSINLSTESYVNGVKGAADATANSQVVGAELGGLLGLDITGQDIADLTDPQYLANVIKNTKINGTELPKELKASLDELAAAAEMLATIAGIEVTPFGTTKHVAKNGLSASATAGSLLITVAPKVPNLDALRSKLAANGTIVPRLDASEYEATGIELKIELPKAVSAASLNTAVLDIRKNPPRTGVATPLVAGIVLIGAAIGVRRFALSK